MTQAVAATAVSLIAVALLTAMSLRADRRFKAERRLPMHWSLNGSINWTVPRPIALAFTPVLAAACLASLTALATFLEPRAGQEHLALPMHVFVALVFVGAHALHLRLIQRTLQR
ncbi:hypothetical protein ACFODL_04675 [Phenylobacterium terrae]|uniref:DUF1648 domain-containing protein n=1 Tax=Phenylobacterium terrae TaxID=2665495 RepID=A0ABW4MZT6_9CAUL